MKASRLRFSFYTSLAVHAAAAGLVVVGIGFAGRHTAHLSEGDPITTLTLIAAADLPADEQPKESSAAPAAPPVPVVTASVPEPWLKRPVEEKAPVVTIPEPAIVPSTALASVTPQAAPLVLPVAPAIPKVQNAVRGDGSSQEPGQDSATKQAAAGIRAHPEYRKNPEPLYPLAARRRGQEGLVLLSVRVTAGGRAARVEVRQSSGFTVLDEAAVRAVREWEFEPARVNARGVESEIEVPVRFRLAE